jgi:hypothetical protein
VVVQVVQRDAEKLMAVDIQAVAWWIIHTCQQIDEGGFTTSGTPDDGQGVAGIQGK